MSDDVDQAREGIEHAHEASEHRKVPGAKRVAILISALAAALAIAELGEKGAQNAALTEQISASDTWSFYQAKNIRANLYAEAADLLEAGPGAGDPKVQDHIKTARASAARMLNDEKTRGRDQLEAEARGHEAKRDRAFELYERYETVVGALQISIVLASVSVVAGIGRLALAAGGIGALAAIYGVLTRLALV